MGVGWVGGEPTSREPLTDFIGFKWNKVQKRDCRLTAGPVHQEEVIVRTLGFTEFIEMAAHTYPRGVHDVVGALRLVLVPVVCKRGNTLIWATISTWKSPPQPRKPSKKTRQILPGISTKPERDMHPRNMVSTGKDPASYRTKPLPPVPCTKKLQNCGFPPLF